MHTMLHGEQTICLAKMSKQANAFCINATVQFKVKATNALLLTFIDEGMCFSRYKFTLNSTHALTVRVRRAKHYDPFLGTPVIHSTRTRTIQTINQLGQKCAHSIPFFISPVSLRTFSTEDNALSKYQATVWYKAPRDSSFKRANSLKG